MEGQEIPWTEWKFHGPRKYSIEKGERRKKRKIYKRKEISWKGEKFHGRRGKMGEEKNL